MPTYVYACKNCDHEFEIFQSFSDNALRTCPQCKERALAKVLFPARVGFKGPGFYVNDSASSAASSTSTGDSSSTATSTATPSTSTSSD